MSVTSGLLWLDAQEGTLAEPSLRCVLVLALPPAGPAWQSARARSMAVKDVPSTSKHQSPVQPEGGRRRPALVCALPRPVAIALPDSGTLIGRSWLAERGLADVEVSTRHLRIDRAGGALRVGPHSAGAEPGPAGYGKGGEEPAVTDANLFLGYLNRPDATDAVMRDGWFRTGDMAVRDADGYVRIVGRRATDLIKSGGYKIGAGEIENALLEHPGVAEVAVTGEPDDDLGERIVAWVVPSGAAPAAGELADHVARLLAPHKRPRVVHFLESLPRNDMGKVVKRQLRV